MKCHCDAKPTAEPLTATPSSPGKPCGPINPGGPCLEEHKQVRRHQQKSSTGQNELKESPLCLAQVILTFKSVTFVPCVPGGPRTPSCPEHLHITLQHTRSATALCRESQSRNYSGVHFIFPCKSNRKQYFFGAQTRFSSTDNPNELNVRINHEH